jgi:hypothetical protein
MNKTKYLNCICMFMFAFGCDCLWGADDEYSYVFIYDQIVNEVRISGEKN